MSQQQLKNFAADIFIRNGEYTYNIPMAIKAESLESALTKADEHNKTFYDGEAEFDAEHNGYFFHAGGVFVRINQIVEIDEADYDVLKRFTIHHAD